MTTSPAYLNARLSIARRVADLLSRMTVEEKVGQMMQLDARDDLDEMVLHGHVGSILHTSPERIVRAPWRTERAHRWSRTERAHRWWRPVHSDC